MVGPSTVLGGRTGPLSGQRLIAPQKNIHQPTGKDVSVHTQSWIISQRINMLTVVRGLLRDFFNPGVDIRMRIVLIPILLRGTHCFAALNGHRSFDQPRNTGLAQPARVSLSRNPGLATGVVLLSALLFDN